MGPFKKYLIRIFIFLNILTINILINAGCNSDQGFSDSTEDAVVQELLSEFESLVQKEERNYKTDRILVRFNTETYNSLEIKNEQDQVFDKLESIGVEKIKNISDTGISVLKITDQGKGLNEAIEELKDSGLVQSIEPDYIVYSDNIPNDTYFDVLWGMNNTGQSSGTADSDIDAPEAWDIEVGSGNIVVAVIDTGVDYNHADLVHNMWHNPGEIPGNGVDDDRNGYIDDIYGIDARNGDTDPMDDAGHGTHCAGTIGARGNNSTGVTGVCHNVKIMALKFLGDDGTGYTSGAIECIDYAIKNGAVIISNSWGGGGYSTDLFNAVSRTRSAGILFIAAAGNTSDNNDTNPHYPSSFNHDNIISVAATDRNDALASFSNYGNQSVDVAAPGQAIMSTIPGNSYGYMSGTSMATPHVSGIAALIKSYNSTLPWEEIKRRIIESVDKKNGLSGMVAASGRVNAYFALINNRAPEVIINSIEDNSIVKGIVPISLEVTDDGGIEKVEVLINGKIKFTAEEPPYEFNWDTAGYESNSGYVITAKAYDFENRTGVLQH